MKVSYDAPEERKLTFADLLPGTFFAFVDNGGLFQKLSEDDMSGKHDNALVYQYGDVVSLHRAISLPAPHYVLDSAPVVRLSLVGVEVLAPGEEKTPEPGHRGSLRERCNVLMNKNLKIPAIKLLREETGLGLADAKSTVEFWYSKRFVQWTMPSE